MKNPCFRLFGRPVDACACSMAALIITLTFGGTDEAQAQIRKEDNFDNLDQSTSWVGGVAPGVGDIAQWDNRLTGAITSDLGVDLSWQGIRVLDPGGNITITGFNPNILTLGASGIDLSASTRNLTISSPLILGAAQTWSAASGRTLQITSAGVGAISGTGPLMIHGPGRVRLGGLAATYTFTGGLNLAGGTGLTNTAVVSGGAALITNANLIFDMAAVVPTGTGLNLSTPALTTGGGTVHTIGGARSGSGTPAWVQSSALIVSAGNTNFTQTRGSSARVINQFSSVTRSAGGTVNFRDVLNSDGSNNANSGGYRANNAATVNGIVPFITYTTSGTNTSWFVPSATGNGTANNAAAYSAFTASTDISLGTAVQNSTVVTNVLLSESATVNSIRFNDAAENRTVTIAETATLTLGAGAILVTNNGFANHVITGGTVTGGNPGSGSAHDLIVHQHNNTTSLTIDSKIADHTAIVEEVPVVSPTALTKTGAGILVIGGQAIHTGPTSVNAGSLLVTGSLIGTSATTVHLGGTLGGTGTVPGGAAVSGAIAPGMSVGTLSTGPLAFSAGSSLVMEIDTSAVEADKLVVTGFTTGGNAVNLVLSDVGGDAVLPTGTKLTLVDYTTWPGTDLLTYGGIPVPNLSTITLGTNSFTVNYSDAAVDGSALTLTVLPRTTFQLWMDQFAAELPNSADRVASADPDGDGRDNLLEFALEGNPADGSNAGKLAVATGDSNDAGSAPDLSITLAVRDDAVTGAGPGGSITLTVDGMVYTIQASQSLLAWDSPVNEVPASPLVPAPGAGWTARTFKVTDSDELPDKRFIRVGVAQ